MCLSTEQRKQMKRMRRLLTILLLCWCGILAAQNFPYHLSVETVPGQCYDDARLIFTLTDDNGNVVQIDPQTHNAVNITQYPLYNVQYHYQNVSSGGVQYDYSNDVMLMAGTYCVGVTANVPIQGGFAQVDTTFCNVQVTTAYNHLEASALLNLASGTLDMDGQERYGYRPSFHCKDMGRIQLKITQGSFPYEVTILDELQDTVRHVVFHDRVNSGTFNQYANYRDYYTFDSLPFGTYSIKVSDSCGYIVPISFTIPDAEPIDYGFEINLSFTDTSNESKIPFTFDIVKNPGFNGGWYNYTYPYLDSIIQYRFLNPGNDIGDWRPSATHSVYNAVYDTLPNYCVIFNDTVTVQVRDLCRDTVLTFAFRFLPQFDCYDTMDMVHTWDSAIQDTCVVHLQSGISTQSYKIAGTEPYIFSETGYTLIGWTNQVRSVPFRYYQSPISYDVWSLPDSVLLAHNTSEEFTNLGDWVTFYSDTMVPVHISFTDAGGCLLAEKDTVFVYETEPVDTLHFWFECHNDIDDDGYNHCCDARYLWIQEHGVAADTFRRNMTLRLMDSPLYDKFNFTAVRQNGVWTVTPDDTDNHSTYVEFSYDDGWRATVRDSVCLAPGRYTFEVSTDCGVDTITYEWIGYYWDSLGFTSPAQYEIRQVCDHIEVIQVSTGLEHYIYTIDPSVSNDEPIQEECLYYTYSTSTSSGYYPVKDSYGRYVYSFSLPGIYYIINHSENFAYSGLYDYVVSGGCSTYCESRDTIVVAFSYLDFDMASALLCDLTSTTGIVSAQAINGNPPYTYTLYDQPGAAGNVIASNSTGFFDNVPMTAGQQLSVQVTDSCSTSFYINVTAAMITHGSLLWEHDGNAGVPHCVGDTVHLVALTLPPPATYQWTGPNGFTSTSQTVDIALSDTSQTGWYYVEILNTFCGPVINDSLYITVVPAPLTTVLYDTTCQWAGYEGNGFDISAGETSIPGNYVFTRLQQNNYYPDTVVLNLTVTPSTDTVLHATAYGSYTWNGTTYTTSGAYNRVAEGCRKETLLLTVIDTLQVTVSADDDTLCRGEETSLHTSVTNAYAVPPVAVGDILCTDGDIVKPSVWPVAGKTALGVVFYVDNSGAHGWAVHLHDQDTSVRWLGSGGYTDIPELANYSNNGDMNGYANTQVLRNLGDATRYPAAWAVDFPNGWYLPAIGQLRLLYGEFNTLNGTLQMLNGTPFQMETESRYWSSTEEDTWYALDLRGSGGIASNVKSSAIRVRSIRNF